MCPSAAIRDRIRAMPPTTRSRLASIPIGATLLSALLFPGSCASRMPGPSSPPSAPNTPEAAAAAAGGRSDQTGARRTHENLNAVLWMQTAVEYRASALQAYAVARRQLDAALADPQWTAALEQTGNISARPPAVILDLDETVFDNSAFQARMVADVTFFNDTAWNAWCEERKAAAIPGAVEFLKYASGRGVTPVFITNRIASVEPATRDVLTRLGVPLDAARDTVLTKNEKPEWSASDKTPRRAAVAADFRVLLLVGDDLGDFIGNARGTTAEREARSAEYDARWGARWIMVPNPTYGSWETALTSGQTGLSDAQTLAIKYGRLGVGR